jgi:epoxyqueuosine reductase
LLALSEQQFREVFRSSAVRRTKWSGLLRNSCIAAGNAAKHMTEQDRTRTMALLAKLEQCDAPNVAEHARWALAKFQRSAPDGQP